MRTRPNRVRRISHVAGNRPLGPDAAHTILTIEYDVGEDSPLVTTAGPHGLVGSESITISGTSGGLYDGAHTVETVPSATTFTIDGLDAGSSTGGQWVLV